MKIFQQHLSESPVRLKVPCKNTCRIKFPERKSRVHVNGDGRVLCCSKEYRGPAVGIVEIRTHRQAYLASNVGVILVRGYSMIMRCLCPCWCCGLGRAEARQQAGERATRLLVEPPACFAQHKQRLKAVRHFQCRTTERGFAIPVGKVGLTFVLVRGLQIRFISVRHF
jgi:hypothetical protein